VPPADTRPIDPSHYEVPSRTIDRTRRHRARERAQAERIVSEMYLPHRLCVTAGSVLDMELISARFGQTTAGLLSYGAAVSSLTDDTTQFHVNVTLAGRAVSCSGAGKSLMTTTGQAVVFRVGEPVQVTWSADCRQLCLMTPRNKVEDELEHLLGRSLHEPLIFERSLRTDIGRLWQPALGLIQEELEDPSGLVTRPVVARHVEELLVDGLLLTQPHNYQDLLRREAPPGPVSAIARAAELLEELPTKPWTLVNLAQQVHLSVRALQYGFRRDFEVSPMAYLRRLRLRRAHVALDAASPATTTVHAVALECGFIHLSRFAASYREAYAEAPSETLARRGPDDPPHSTF
jgi:AraC-like DNA-binding protein